LFLRLVVLAAVIGLVEWIVPGIHVHGGFLTYFWLAILFSVINLVIGSLLMLISLPLIILTLGLFLFIVNGAVLAITAAVSSHLDIDSFGAAVLGAFLITVFNGLAHLILPITRKH